ncbi:3-amino-4-hydroxybenzoic acid synthase [Clostridium cavendishii DSM 21758]|uniref:3-amino-4-hydroxybenzoic acid synthase n=1 Tax=Clostridium cavendishii DSM 21758 TaxID=1121302 RepID=A0A1M6IZF2_9CLOT|nr:3-dehydroquinate synthase II [Clostridium cavendishii]SHJ39836.1 3-amino-4-hydroxybenzoic acid synthase [Clostridium cavendishii DSM 21758]
MINKKDLWFDVTKLNEGEIKCLVPLATNNGYEGFFITPDQTDVVRMLPANAKVLLSVCNENTERALEVVEELKDREVIVFSESREVLNKFDNVDTGLFLSVNDRESLDNTVEMSHYYKNIIIEFKSETNIPLELVLAFSQKNNCRVCKRVFEGSDGWVASMVMEMGSHAVLLTSKEMKDVLELKEQLTKLGEYKMDVKELTVVGIEHIGMGDRVCVDTTSLLKEDEGLILGSNSYGGILVSSETHFLPYMELRPFRVNAGALHLYSWCRNDKTAYLSELRAGSEVMTVDSKGNTRSVSVGRIKMERRPLLLVKAQDDAGIEVNVILQDDWHVRVIGPNGAPLNCTELKKGDKVLGYTCIPGRHVGIKIDENIIEK